MDPLQERRDKYFKRLQVTGTCYLDHAGAGLYSDNQVDAVRKDLINNVFGNPHSANSVSLRCRDSVDQVRNRVLKHFNTTADEYSVIFTSGATAAMKMVADSFDWADSSATTRSHFVYAQDNHTSVLGLAESFRDKPVIVKSLHHDNLIDIFTQETLEAQSEISDPCNLANSLFVYSAECNFSGVKYPLDWIRKCHEGYLNEYCGLERKHRGVKWLCLLDAATYLSTNELDLTEYKPDFVCVSFYKIFGYPTGLGALLVRNTSSGALKRRYFGGGTVKIALSDGSFHELRDSMHERFEDGTVNYLAILSLIHGFSSINEVTGGMRNVAQTTFNLAQYTYIKLLKLHHSNGKRAVELYTDTDYSSHLHQGGIVTFNLLRDNGEYIGFMEVLNLANLHNIQLRTGCFCNPGACQRHLKLTNEQLHANFEAGHVCGDSRDLLNGHPTGAVRVSFGYSSTQCDADKLLDLIIRCFVTKPIIEKLPDDWGLRLKKLNRFVPGLQIKEKINLLQNGASEKKDQKNEEANCLSDKSSVSSFPRMVSCSQSGKEPQLHIKRIFLYPIKSCAYFEVENSWIINETGLQFDREWMIIDERGVALTQKYEPRLCFIQPRVNLKTQHLELHYKDHHGVCRVPLNLAEENSINSGGNSVSLCQSKVCGDNITIRDCGEDVALWLAKLLDRDNIRLVRHIQRHSKNNSGINKLPLTLSNQGQYLLINMASVQWLRELVAESIDLTEENLMHRFRCNFVISPTEKPMEELKWTELKIGNLKFKVDSPCTRCPVICVDQKTGEKINEPFTTLAANLKGKVQFGIYLRLIEDSLISQKIIYVNDTVENIKP
nr:PREDICTED: molybdenum cofactor sulfurase 1 [Bemisia tabaci]